MVDLRHKVGILETGVFCFSRRNAVEGLESIS